VPKHLPSFPGGVHLVPLLDMDENGVRLLETKAPFSSCHHLSLKREEYRMSIINPKIQNLKCSKAKAL
jgi:hypothetical protein